MDKNENQQLRCKSFFDKKVELGARATNTNEVLAEELRKPVIKKNKIKKYM